ncbi:CRISPR-associated Cas1 family protein [Kineothrix alysoides]|uniref:CRISPR-associated endonuclease Cas1 n=1 Tax=Kineothrix alysoides TaxID=1469948 RepID=A0A4R1QSA3_9FIRM|nr:type I-C CRISPR-associated endonuclease Cas1c [Kineothrix alysoides]TCL55903.1 CRISPR-associated Cas1 family protein [Kineothrix alysoides]
MRKLLNILYITTPDAYLSLDGENIVVLKNDETKIRVPLHNLEGIITFGYAGASPALMGKCAEENIALTFLTAQGRFLARVVGKTRGNVILRREQYRIADEELKALGIAKNCILGKVYNCKHVIDRAIRDHAARIDCEKLKLSSEQMASSLDLIKNVNNLDSLRGYEGEAASRYFSIFNELILQQKEAFLFSGRNKRPPLDNVNALLSFAYTLLTYDVASALESVGLDSFVGFLHTDRPGRVSLALDMMEELRPFYADRFVISLINKRIINEKGFEKQENGAVFMTNETRKEILRYWQERKQEKIKHPFLNETIEWGLVPYVQAMLLARYIRGDLDGYPPFMWK